MRFPRKKTEDKKKRNKVGLCLSGGGARGFAHIGILRAFEEAGIDFDLCVGTSAGAIVGAMYCAGVTSAEMERYSDVVDLKDVHNGRIISPNDPMKIGRIVTDFIGDVNIEELKKKFCCVAVDLVEAKQVLFESGKVGPATAASSCVPLFFRPLEMGKMHLADGGLLNNIPADICRMLGADKVVTADVNPTRGSGTRDLGTMAVLKATFSIMNANASVLGYKYSDIVIAADTSRFSSTDKSGYKRMIEIGYEAARPKCEEIKKLFEAER